MIETRDTVKLGALGAFLIRVHDHQRQPDPERPWLRRAGEPCEACDELRAALELEPAPTSGETVA